MTKVTKTTSIWGKFIFPIQRFFRERRGKRIMKTFPNLPASRVCDVGGSRHFWENLGIDVPRDITIFNITQGEDFSLTGSGSHLKYMIYDGNRLPVNDHEYDVCISNSVIEHVPREARENFAKEVMRAGKKFFVQTPAFECPFEPHYLLPFIHWFPKKLMYPLVLISPWRILSRPDAATIQEYYFETYLLSKRELQRLFPGARIETERVFFLLPKSYYVIGGE